jgi:hypothetical protein
VSAVLITSSDNKPAVNIVARKTTKVRSFATSPFFISGANRKTALLVWALTILVEILIAGANSNIAIKKTFAQ